MVPGSSSFRFGRVEVLPVQRQLRIDGIPTAVGARALDLLLALIERRERVVSKNELLDLAWPGLVVEEGNLKVQVSALRKLIGTQAIATIPARGYRFAQPLDEDVQPRSIGAEPGADKVRAALPPLEPLQDSSLAVIGRDDDLAALQQLLGQHRVVTVTGAGGIGKTTLALAAMQALSGSFEDGVVRVELADLVDPLAVAMAVAQALQLPPHQGSDKPSALVAALRDKRMLLVIDNAGHVIDATAQLVSELVAGTAHLCLLVTSQAPLRVLAERVFRLGPLAVPEAGTLLNEALCHGAVALFAERGRAADRHFVVDQDNLDSVIEICRNLDGLALAIELAAARLPLLGVAGLARKLDERLRLLGGGSRAAPTRQQTLRTALDWSHGLLSATERGVLRRLAVFVGGFSLELAAAVAGDSTLDEWDVIDTLGTLVDRSLVAVDVGEPPRYRLLESTRAYALERLEAAAEMALTKRRHALALCARVERAAHSLWTTAELPWLAQHMPELDNLRAAIDWSTREEPALAVALLGASFPLFACLALVHESRERSGPLADRLTELSLPAPIAARFLRTRSLQMRDVSVSAQHDFAMQAVQGFRACGDLRGLYETLFVLATSFQSFHADSQSALAEMEVIEHPDWPRTLRALACIARSRVAYADGRMDDNRAALEAALALLEGSGADRLTILVLADLADHVLLTGPMAEAVMRGQELVALLRRMRRNAFLPLALCNLANAHLQQGACRQPGGPLRTHLPPCASSNGIGCAGLVMCTRFWRRGRGALPMQPACWAGPTRCASCVASANPTKHVVATKPETSWRPNCTKSSCKR